MPNNNTRSKRREIRQADAGRTIQELKRQLAETRERLAAEQARKTPKPLGIQVASYTYRLSDYERAALAGLPTETPDGYASHLRSQMAQKMGQHLLETGAIHLQEQGDRLDMLLYYLPHPMAFEQRREEQQQIERWLADPSTFGRRPVQLAAHPDHPHDVPESYAGRTGQLLGAEGDRCMVLLDGVAQNGAAGVRILSRSLRPLPEQAGASEGLLKHLLDAGLRGRIQVQVRVSMAAPEISREFAGHEGTVMKCLDSASGHATRFMIVLNDSGKQMALPAAALTIQGIRGAEQ